MKQLTDNCISCGAILGHKVVIKLRTKQGIKPVEVKICSICIAPRMLLNEQVQQILGENLDYDNL